MFADDVVALLSEAGLGTAGDTLFIGSGAVVPQTAGPIGVAITYAGPPPTGIHGQATFERHPRIQVSFRASDALAAEQAALAALRALGRVTNRVVNGTHYAKIRVLTDLIDLSPDKSGRPRVAFNAEADCSQVTP